MKILKTKLFKLLHLAYIKLFDYIKSINFRFVTVIYSTIKLSLVSKDHVLKIFKMKTCIYTRKITQYLIYISLEIHLEIKIIIKYLLKSFSRNLGSV